MVYKKKLVIASDSFLPRWDGIARFLIEVIPEISKTYETILIAPDFHTTIKTEVDLDVKIVRIPTYNFKIGDYSPAKFNKKLISTYVNQADLVWTQTIGSIGSTAIEVAKKGKKPIASFVHSIEWELVSKALSPMNPLRKLSYSLTKKHARKYYNKTDLLMLPSKEVMDLFEWEHIAVSKRIKKKIVNLGTNTDFFIPPLNKRVAKTNLNLDPESVIIGYSGRIGREKDLITLFRAFLRIAKRHDNLKLLIVGEGLPEIRDLVKDKHNVIFAGAQNNVVPYLQAMDIFVLPSLTETTSLATMEAMSCGLAVVSTPVGFVKNYIKNGENGLFFNFHDEFDLSKQLEKLVINPSIREKLGINARETIKQKFGWRRTTEQIEEALRELN